MQAYPIDSKEYRGIALDLKKKKQQKTVVIIIDYYSLNRWIIEDSTLKNALQNLNKACLTFIMTVWAYLWYFAWLNDSYCSVTKNNESFISKDLILPC